MNEENNIAPEQVQANETVPAETQPEQSAKTAESKGDADANYNAKLIREATTSNVLNKIGVTSFEEAQALIQKAKELEEAQLSVEEKTLKELEDSKRIIEENRLANQRLIQERELLSRGVRPEQLEDFVKLTSGLEGDELDAKLAVYNVSGIQPAETPVVQNTGAVSSQPIKVETKSLLDKYNSIPR